MDLLASYDSDSDSDNGVDSGVPLIPPLTDSSASSTQYSGSTSSASSSAQGFSTDSTQGSLSSSSSRSSSNATATAARVPASASAVTPRFQTRLPPPQANRATIAPGEPDKASPAEQRARLLQIASPPAPLPAVPSVRAAPDGGRLVAQFLMLKQPPPPTQLASSPSSSSMPAPPPAPVHFNVKFAASPQLHNSVFVARQAQYLGVSDGYVSKFIQPGDRAKARAAVRRRVSQRTKVEFTTSTKTA